MYLGAIQFFDEMPTVELLMPSLEITSVEEMLQARKAESGRLRYEPT